jgi:hypothetical protein
MSAFDDGLWTRLVDEHDADRVGLRDVSKQQSRRPLVLGAGGLAAVSLAGVVAAVLSLTGEASNAFAGWTAQPTAPTARQLAAAKAYCDANMGFPGLPLKLVDGRGPFTFMIYSDGGSNDFCTVGPGFRNASGWSTSPPVKVPSGRLFLWDDHVASLEGEPYGTMIASVADDVTAVRVTLDNGSNVTATVQNGFAVAWWPGAHHLGSAQLTTPAGTETQTFRPYPCDVHNCDGGGPHGAAPGGGPGGG